MASTSSECGMLIKQINDCIGRISNNQLRDADLTLTQIRYLSFIHQHNGELVSFKEIQSHFGVSQPTVTGILKRMTSKKLIFSSVDPGEGHAKSYGLTQFGVMQLEGATAGRVAQEEQLLAPLSPSERKQFQEMLSRVLDNLRD